MYCLRRRATPVGSPSTADYIEEILGHAGVCYDRIEPDDLSVRLPRLRLLLTVGEATLGEAQRQSLAQWVAEGGAWLSLAGLCGLEATLGVVPEKPAYVGFGAGLCSLGEGYLQATGVHPVLGALPAPLHFFGGIAVTADAATTIATGLDLHQRPTPRAVLTENRSGDGCAMLIAIDLTGTIVRINRESPSHAMGFPLRTAPRLSPTACSRATTARFWTGSSTGRKSPALPDFARSCSLSRTPGVTS